MKLQLSTLVSVALFTSTAFAQAPKSTLSQEGVINKLRPQVEQIFQFTFDGPRLKVDRKGWGEPPKNPANPNVVTFNNGPPIENIFTQFRNAAGGLTSSSMSISNRHREVSFSGNVLNGRVVTRGDFVRLELEETNAPQRSLEWQDDGQGAMRFMLSNPDGDLILIQQPKQGKASLAGVVGGKAFAGSSDNFLALYKQERHVMDAHVLPVLQSLGIGLIPSPQTTEMKKAVRALITRTPEILSEGKRLMEDLDSNKFPVRDRASRVLNERFEVYKDLIQARLKEANISAEASSRLNKILAAHPDAQKVSQTISALDLTRDPAYLVVLLEEAPTEERAKVAAHLESVTGQRHGEDVAAWKRWLGEKKR